MHTHGSGRGRERMEISGERLPDRRTSIRGIDREGVEVTLVRAISQKLYRCPLCHGAVDPGEEHVIVRYRRPGPGPHHFHWHRRCVAEGLVRELRAVRKIPAGQEGGAQHRPRGRGQRRRR